MYAISARPVKELRKYTTYVTKKQCIETQKIQDFLIHIICPNFSS